MSPAVAAAVTALQAAGMRGRAASLIVRHDADDCFEAWMACLDARDVLAKMGALGTCTDGTLVAAVSACTAAYLAACDGAKRAPTRCEHCPDDATGACSVCEVTP